MNLFKLQLSNKYKSSAELVSELLQRQVPFTNHQQHSKNIPNDNSSEPSFDMKKKTKLVKSISDSMKHSSELKSVELVRSIKQNERKVGRNECINPELENTEMKSSNRTSSQSPMPRL